jgi:hypothetical protein
MRPLRRLRTPAVLAVLAAFSLGLAAPAGASAAPAHVPKVVVVVGPAGAATDHYRAAGDAAAETARRAGADVTEITSPNATWPAVRSALEDASLVVYLGHGNGWPSRYRPTLYPPTQNGLGLNPVAGGDDEAHQYFGEAYLEKYVRLAPNAVVVLSHLCYASGLSEPGLPEGTLDEARQRVDNFAAGWIAAGARAVVAEAYLDPAYYVAAVLSGRGSVGAAWQDAPTANDHVLRFASERRHGFVDLLDPVHAAGSGFERSLVVRGDLSSAAVVAGGQGSGRSGVVQPPAPPAPTLASVGATVAAPTLAGLPVAGATRTLTLPIAVPAESSALLDGLELSVRWDPLDVPAQAVPDAPVPGSGSGTDGASPGPSDGAEPSPTEGTTGGEPGAASAPPGASAAPSGDPLMADPGSGGPGDPFALVMPEEPGQVVDPMAARGTRAGWRVRTALPAAPGLYSLTVRLHDGTAVAFDETSQALVPRLLVRVVSATSATIVAPPTVDAEAGASFDLPVAAMNTGSTDWAVPDPAAPRPGSGAATIRPVALTARWIGLDPSAESRAAVLDDPAPAPTDVAWRVYREVRPGDHVDGTLSLVAPESPGNWLLLVDVSTPEVASLVAAGSAPALVRVTVRPAAPAASPEPDRG